MLGKTGFPLVTLAAEVVVCHSKSEEWEQRGMTLTQTWLREVLKGDLGDMDDKMEKKIIFQQQFININFLQANQSLNQNCFPEEEKILFIVTKCMLFKSKSFILFPSQIPKILLQENLACQHNSFQKHACNPKHSYI